MLTAENAGKWIVIFLLVTVLTCLLLSANHIHKTCINQEKACVTTCTAQTRWMIGIPAVGPMIIYGLDSELNSNLSQSQERLEDLH